MPGFFFHFVHRGAPILDPENVDLPDLATAHVYAMRLIERITFHFAEAADWREWVIEITDERGQSALTVLFPVCVRPPIVVSSAAPPLGGRQRI